MTSTLRAHKNLFLLSHISPVVKTHTRNTEYLHNWSTDTKNVLSAPFNKSSSDSNVTVWAGFSEVSTDCGKQFRHGLDKIIETIVK
jgi:hypothetical protein